MDLNKNFALKTEGGGFFLGHEHPECLEEWNGCSILKVKTTTWNTTGQWWWHQRECISGQIKRADRNSFFVNQSLSLIRQEAKNRAKFLASGDRHRIIFISKIDGTVRSYLLSSSDDENQQKKRFAILKNLFPSVCNTQDKNKLFVATDESQMIINYNGVLICQQNECHQPSACGRVKAIHMLITVIQTGFASCSWLPVATYGQEIATITAIPESAQKWRESFVRDRQDKYSVLAEYRLKGSSPITYGVKWLGRRLEISELAGLMIRVWRGKYWHYGIIGTTGFGCLPQVYHYCPADRSNKLERKKNASIKRTNLREFFDQNRQITVLAFHGAYCQIPPVMALQRMRIAVGERKYQLLALSDNGKGNCESVATSAATGISESHQARTLGIICVLHIYRTEIDRRKEIKSMKLNLFYFTPYQYRPISDPVIHFSL